jgi:transcriptional regulator with XRE-family HTH domain
MRKDIERAVVRKICEELILERKRQGISQQRISEDAGLSRTGVRHIESLETNPTLYSLLKLSGALGLDLGELIKEQQSLDLNQ